MCCASPLQIHMIEFRTNCKHSKFLDLFPDPIMILISIVSATNLCKLNCLIFEFKIIANQNSIRKENTKDEPQVARDEVDESAPLVITETKGGNR